MSHYHDILIIRIRAKLWNYCNNEITTVNVLLSPFKYWSEKYDKLYFIMKLIISQHMPLTDIVTLESR